MIVHLTIKTIDRKIYPIDINNQHTIYDLKNQLITKYNFINMELTLILDGKILNNQTIVSNITISNNKYMILLFKKNKNSSTPNIDSSNRVITNSFLDSNNTISSINSNELETTSQSSSIDVVNILENTQSTVLEYIDESIINEYSNTIEIDTSETHNNEIVNNRLDIEDLDNIKDNTDIENNTTTDIGIVENNTTIDIGIVENNTTTELVENNTTIDIGILNNETILEPLRNEILNNETILETLRNEILNSSTELYDYPNLGDNLNEVNNNDLGYSLNINDNNIDNSNMTTSIQPVTEIDDDLLTPILIPVEGPVIDDDLITPILTPVEVTVIDEELEEYVDIFINLLDNSPHLLGILVQRQRNINIASILASKLDYLDYDLALYVIQNNNKFFQRVYEIINGFERGTTKRADIFKSNRNSGTSIEEMFQSILDGNGSIELPPPPQQEIPQQEIPQQEIQISDEQNIVLDRLSEFFPNTERFVLYEALIVCDNNEELAINYLFDNN